LKSIRATYFRKQIQKLNLNTEELQEFVNQNELSYTKIADQARILQFLNDLEEPKSLSIR